MAITVDSYTSTSKREIDTLKADSPFSIRREDRRRYHIEVEGHTFEVAVADGGKSAVLDLNSRGLGQSENLLVGGRDRNWPQSITNLRVKQGGFHLEMMSPAYYHMTTGEDSLDFKIASGPERSRITVQEVSTGIEHVPGPTRPREIRTSTRRR